MATLNRVTSKPDVFERKRGLETALVVFISLIGAFSCKPRETGGYCQLPCEKVCRVSGEDFCVSPNDPNHGCASSTSCDKCDFKNATATCDNDGRCTIGGCQPGFLACDSDESNGCEVNYMSDPKNCGACGRTCSGTAEHAEFTCAQGLCVISCQDGYKDCNKQEVDGCEIEPGVACDAGI